MVLKTRQPKRKEQCTVYVNDELEDKLLRLAGLLAAEGVEVQSQHGPQRPYNISVMLRLLVDEALAARAKADTP